MVVMPSRPPMKPGEIIKKKRLELGMTQEQLGNEVGVQKSAIAKYESGKIENMKRPVIARMSQVLNVSPIDIMALPPMKHSEIEHELLDNVEPVPVYDPVSCGTGTWVDETPEDYIYFPKQWAHYGSDYFANEAAGDSMVPKINNGDYLIFEKTDSLHIGKIHAISLNGRYFVKWVKQFNDGSYWLISENRDYEPIQIKPEDSFRILGILKYRITKEL